MYCYGYPGIISCKHPANEWWRYNVTSSLIGWEYAQNDPWLSLVQISAYKVFWCWRWNIPALGLTHWGRVTHICVGNLTIIGSDNGLPPGRRQAIIWTNAGISLIRPLGTNFNEMLIKFLTFSFMKMRLKVSSAKWRLSCPGLNVLIPCLLMAGHCKYCLKMLHTMLRHYLRL